MVYFIIDTNQQYIIELFHIWKYIFLFELVWNPFSKDFVNIPLLYILEFFLYIFSIIKFSLLHKIPLLQIWILFISFALFFTRGNNYICGEYYGYFFFFFSFSTSFLICLNFLNCCWYILMPLIWVKTSWWYSFSISIHYFLFPFPFLFWVFFSQLFVSYLLSFEPLQLIFQFCFRDAILAVFTVLDFNVKYLLCFVCFMI